jgi:hypothetical protein
MATTTIAGKEVEIDKEGFMQNPDVTEHPKPATEEHFKTGHRGERRG